MAALRGQHHSTFYVENSVGSRSQRVLRVRYVMYALAIFLTLVVCGIGSRVATGAQPGSELPPAAGGGTTGDEAVRGTSSVSEDATGITTQEEGAASDPSTSDTSANASDTSASDWTASAAGTKRGGSPKNKLRLKLSNPPEEHAGDMAPAKKHPCLKTFANMVRAIPENIPAQEKATSLVDLIEACEIKIVCADFDRTMLTVHTGGAWSSSRVADLKGKLSSDFVLFAQELNKRGIGLHVVTFSDRLVTLPGRELAGEKLVRTAIAVNGDPFQVESVVGLRPDVYSDPQVYTALGLTAPPPRNKSYHVQQVADRAQVPVSDILLVDDDRINCSSHCKAGNLALLVLGDGFGFDNIRPVTTSSII